MTRSARRKAAGHILSLYPLSSQNQSHHPHRSSIPGNEPSLPATSYQGPKSVLVISVRAWQLGVEVCCGLNVLCPACSVLRWPFRGRRQWWVGGGPPRSRTRYSSVGEAALWGALARMAVAAVGEAGVVVVVVD